MSWLLPSFLALFVRYRSVGDWWGAGDPQLRIERRLLPSFVSTVVRLQKSAFWSNLNIQAMILCGPRSGGLQILEDVVEVSGEIRNELIVRSGTGNSSVSLIGQPGILLGALRQLTIALGLDRKIPFTTQQHRGDLCAYFVATIFLGKRPVSLGQKKGSSPTLRAVRLVAFRSRSSLFSGANSSAQALDGLMVSSHPSTKTQTPRLSQSHISHFVSQLVSVLEGFSSIQPTCLLPTAHRVLALWPCSISALH